MKNAVGKIDDQQDSGRHILIIGVHGVGDCQTSEVRSLIQQAIDRAGISSEQVYVDECVWNSRKLHPHSRGGLVAELLSRIHAASTSAGRIGFDARTPFCSRPDLHLLKAMDKLMFGLTSFFSIAFPLVCCVWLVSLSSPTSWLRVTLLEPTTHLFPLAYFSALAVLSIGVIAAGTIWRSLGLKWRQSFAVSARRVVLTLLPNVLIVLETPFLFARASTFAIVAAAGLLTLLPSGLLLFYGGEIPKGVDHVQLIGGIVTSLWEFLWILLPLALFSLVSMLVVSFVLGPLLKILADIVRYVGEPTYRRRVQRKLRQKLTSVRGKTVAIVGHSLVRVLHFFGPFCYS